MSVAELHQGEILWYDLGEDDIRPVVVLQNDVANMSRLRTTFVCALTTNLDRARAPGNVLLDRDEGNLSKQDVVNVSQVFTVDRDQLQTHIGRLSPTRVLDILDGLWVLLQPRNLSQRPASICHEMSL